MRSNATADAQAMPHCLSLSPGWPRMRGEIFHALGAKLAGHRIVTALRTEFTGTQIVHAMSAQFAGHQVLTSLLTQQAGAQILQAVIAQLAASRIFHALSGKLAGHRILTSLLTQLVFAAECLRAVETIDSKVANA